MGQSKGGGFKKLPTVTPGQGTFLEGLLNQAAPNLNQAAQGYLQFLPGGGGGKSVLEAAQKNFQQQTIPSILNAFGTNNRGSSALNQALASSASNLNTDLGAILAGMQLQAAQGLGNLGLGQAGIGGQTQQFGYGQRQPPLWQSLLLHGLGIGGQLGGAYLGRPY